MNEELYIGQTSTQVLTITNNGNSDLDWTSSLGDDATFGGSWPGESQSTDALSISQVVSQINNRAMAAGANLFMKRPMERPEVESPGTMSERRGPAARTVQGNNRSTRSLDVLVLPADGENNASDVASNLVNTEQFNSVTTIDARLSLIHI